MVAKVYALQHLLFSNLQAKSKYQVVVKHFLLLNICQLSYHIDVRVVMSKSKQ